MRRERVREQFQPLDGSGGGGAGSFFVILLFCHLV
jgi:hypothetical protein